MKNITRGLIIKKQWLDLKFTGLKTWELRSTKTKVRGTIALIESGTGLIVGQADLVSVIDNLSIPELMANYDKHRVEDESLLQKWRYPWVLENIIKYDEPIPYKHPQGAVIWVKL